MTDEQKKTAWLKAQDAEKGHWAYLWQDSESPERKALVNNEIIKGEFIFQELVDNFEIDPYKDWSALRILDVGCGPLSLVARNKLSKAREGVDPLKYPRWVYESYRSKDFTVHLKPFEEFESNTKFDIILFYNALQHFSDLDAVATKCKAILASKGTILLSEYLEVPTNEAHIQFLESNKLDQLFKSVGFKVSSKTILIRLPGYVERPDGSPIELYVAKIAI